MVYFMTTVVGLSYIAEIRHQMSANFALLIFLRYSIGNFKHCLLCLPRVFVIIDEFWPLLHPKSRASGSKKWWWFVKSTYTCPYPQFYVHTGPIRFFFLHCVWDKELLAVSVSTYSYPYLKPCLVPFLWCDQTPPPASAWLWWWVLQRVYKPKTSFWLQNSFFFCSLWWKGELRPFQRSSSNGSSAINW